MLLSTHTRWIPIILISLVCAACTPEAAKKSVDACQSSASFSEIDSPEQTVQVAGGAAIGQHFSPTTDMVVTRVLLRASSSSLTNFILTFYENANSSMQTIDDNPMARFNMSQTLSSAQVKDFWISLPTPVTLVGGTSYLLGFAPNAPVNLQKGSSTNSGFRTTYRTGSGSGGLNGGASWSSADQENALTFGIEGSSSCD